MARWCYRMSGKRFLERQLLYLFLCPPLTSGHSFYLLFLKDYPRDTERLKSRSGRFHHLCSRPWATSLLSTSRHLFPFRISFYFSFLCLSLSSHDMCLFVMLIVFLLPFSHVIPVLFPVSPEGTVSWRSLDSTCRDLRSNYKPFIVYLVFHSFSSSSLSLWETAIDL